MVWLLTQKEGHRRPRRCILEYTSGEPTSLAQPRAQRGQQAWRWPSLELLLHLSSSNLLPLCLFIIDFEQDLQLRCHGQTLQHVGQARSLQRCARQDSRE